MQGTVAKTFLYPIKGMQGVDMTKKGLMIDPKLGVIGDRNYAVYRRPNDPPTEWAPKGKFLVCMNQEGMATSIGTGLTEDDLDQDHELDPDWVRGMLMGRPNINVDACSLVHTKGAYHLADTNKPCVSFLNLASVRWLEQHIGVPIDPRRFRMNVWVEGLPPWAELDYITAFEQGAQFPMQVNGSTFWCDDLCERCRAIEQNPTTGKWDLGLQDIIAAALTDYGYKGSPHRQKMAVMGWLAIPITNHLLRVGDGVSFGNN